MSNETPQADGEPTPSVPEAPVPEVPAAATPQQPQETPTAETTPIAHDGPAKAAGDEDDVESPTATATTAPAPAPVPAAAAPERPAGVFIPKWVALVAAAIVAALVFGGIGYAIGDSSGSSDSRNASAFPGNAGDGGPFGNGRGQLPGNGNGNGNRNGTSAGGAFLGVAVQTANGGVQITDVQSGSAAADAGLKSGDVVTAIDGTDVTTAAALQSAVRSHSIGDQVTITYTRDGKSATAKATLGSRSVGQSS